MAEAESKQLILNGSFVRISNLHMASSEQALHLLFQGANARGPANVLKRRRLTGERLYAGPVAVGEQAFRGHP